MVAFREAKDNNCPTPPSAVGRYRPRRHPWFGRLLIPAAFLIASTSALHAQDTSGTGAPQVDCTCRYKGIDYHVGETICLTQQSGLTKAVCTMVLNNTSWKMTDQPCPSASLLPLQDLSPQNVPKVGAFARKRPAAAERGNFNLKAHPG